MANVSEHTSVTSVPERKAVRFANERPEGVDVVLTIERTDVTTSRDEERRKLAERQVDEDGNEPLRTAVRFETDRIVDLDGNELLVRDRVTGQWRDPCYRRAPSPHNEPTQTTRVNVNDASRIAVLIKKWIVVVIVAISVLAILFQIVHGLITSTHDARDVTAKFGELSRLLVHLQVPHLGAVAEAHVPQLRNNGTHA